MTVTINTPNQPIPNPKKPLKVAFLRRLVLGITIGLGFIATGTALVANKIMPQALIASDHDDGETDTKGRNVNITDLYVFREIDQNPAASSNDLIFILNTNPRSLARQQYYFSSNARYEFRITRATGNDSNPTGKTDIGLRFEFTPPDANQQQRVRITATRDGQTFVAENAVTTPLNRAPVVNQVALGGSNLSVFAGLREDPFFFDVEQFFRVRAGALGNGPAVNFRSPETAVDFAKGYNVNAIAVRVPIQFLKGNINNASTFDVWARIFVPNGSGDFVAVERFGRPAVNEGLIVTNDYLNTLNAVGPAFEAAALSGIQPQANAAGPIVAEAKRTLKSLGNSDARVDTLIGAFLPDVMRIDTLQSSGYGKALNAKGSPITGRLLKDDVVDVTLQVLTNNPAASDNVSYEGTSGNPAQGHQPLSGAFPYLAPAN